MKSTHKMHSFLAYVLILALLICTPMSSLTTVQGFAATSQSDNGDNVDKILYIVHSQEDIDNITNSSGTADQAYLADFYLPCDITNEIIEKYSTIGIPYDIAVSMDRNLLFSGGARVYVYGELTITDYMQLLNGPLVVTKVVSLGEDEIDSSVTKDVTLVDDGIQYSVIGWTTMHTMDKGLLCTIDNGELPLEPSNYYKAVSSNYLELQTKCTPYSIEIVDEGIDNASYYAGGETHLDWYLHKDLGETSADRDYYCIETNTWAKSDDGGSQIECISVKTSIPKGYGDLKSAEPHNTLSLSGSISVDLSSGTVTVGVGTSSKPSVSRNMSPSKGTVEWEFRNGIEFKGLEEGFCSTLTAWSTPTTNSTKIDIYYKSSVQLVGNIPLSQSWQKVSVSF